MKMKAVLVTAYMRGLSVVLASLSPRSQAIGADPYCSLSSLLRERSLHVQSHVIMC